MVSEEVLFEAIVDDRRRTPDAGHWLMAKKNFFVVCVGGRGAGDRVSELFFTKSLNEKKKIWGGGGGRL